MKVPPPTTKELDYFTEDEIDRFVVEMMESEKTMTEDDVELAIREFNTMLMGIGIIVLWRRGELKATGFNQLGELTFSKA